MANAKSLPDAKAGKERVKHVGRVGRANGLTELFCRSADAIREKNKVGKWGSGGVGEWGSGGVSEWRSGGVGEWRSLGEEGSGLNQSRRIAAKGGVAVARLGRLALEFRGNCAAERIKPLACLGANRNSDGCCSRADACAPCGFGYAESSLRCAAVHSRSTASRCKTTTAGILVNSGCRV